MSDSIFLGFPKHLPVIDPKLLFSGHNQFKGILTHAYISRADRLHSLFEEIWHWMQFVTSDNPSVLAAAVDENTKAIYVESIGNPKYNVSPINEIANVCVLVFVSVPRIEARRRLTNTRSR